MVRSTRCYQKILHTLPVPHWQVALVTPFASTNLRWGIEALPQQIGVYVPRRLCPVDGAVTGAAARIAAATHESCRLCPDSQPAKCLHSSDRQNVVYAAAGGVSTPTSRKSTCMLMGRAS